MAEEKQKQEPEVKTQLITDTQLINLKLDNIMARIDEIIKRLKI